MSRRALLGAALVLASGAGCATREAAPADEPRIASAASAEVHPQFAERAPVEVAVMRPSGRAPHPFLEALRDGLYRELIDRGYSPLSPEYLDAAPPDASAPGGPAQVQAEVTDRQRTSDGGMLVSGDVLIFAPGAVPEVLYRMRLESLHVPPVPGTEARNGGPEAGRRLGAALLQGLPPRVE